MRRKNKWTAREKGYIAHVGFEPKKTEDVLTMNYCFAWCDAYGRSMKEWFDEGFGANQYGPIIDRRKSKIMQLKLETHQ